MGATQSQEEQIIAMIPYAVSMGFEKTGQKCEVFRNPEAYDKGKLIAQIDPSINSVYQHFE